MLARMASHISHIVLVAAAVATRADVNTTLPWLHVQAVDNSSASGAASIRSHILADDVGREVMLHGVCLESESRTTAPWVRPLDAGSYDGQCPPNYAEYAEPPICGVDAGKGRFAANTSDYGGNDFAQMRALGLNVVRLCLSWSDLEQTPGVYNSVYIQRIQQMVSWAAEQGIYVILDMHEDLYSLFVQPDNSTGPGIPGVLDPAGGQDGAPSWAVYDPQGWPALSPFGIGDLNLKVLAGFQSFYENTIVPGLPQGSAPGPGLQDHYIGAVAALMRPFINTSTVLGLEIINEPLTGLDLDPFDQASTLLYPLYRRVVQALTGLREGLAECPAGQPLGNASGVTCAYPDLGLHDLRHIFFAEPCALRNTLDFSLMDPVPWTNYSNIVHTPHVYTHVFTADQEIPWLFPNKTIPDPSNPSVNISVWSYPPSWDLAYTSALSEASAMNSVVFVTEFGAGMHEDSYLVEPTMAAAERAMVNGWTLWSWKSNCNWGPQCANESWTVYSPAPQNSYPNPNPPNMSLLQNGPLSTDRERILGRTHARGVVGSLLAFHFNTSWPANSSSKSSNGDEVGNGVVTSIGLPPAPVTGGRTFWMFANVSQAAYDRAVAAYEAAAGPAGADTSGLGAVGPTTDLYIPRSVPASYTTTVIGTNVVGQDPVTLPDGSRTVSVYVTGPGLYGVVVGPPTRPGMCGCLSNEPVNTRVEACCAQHSWIVDGIEACAALASSLGSCGGVQVATASTSTEPVLELMRALVGQLHARGAVEGEKAAQEVIKRRLQASRPVDSQDGDISLASVPSVTPSEAAEAVLGLLDDVGRLAQDYRAKSSNNGAV